MQSRELPWVDQYTFSDPPDVKGVRVEFRLLYRGSLPAESKGGDSRRADKNRIRRALHVQLRELWKQFFIHPGIPRFSSPDQFPENDPNELAERFKRLNKNNHAYRFVPLIGEPFSASCSLDILFLRRDQPGNLVKHGGDIDNRIKVLFDGLRMPELSTELPDDAPGPDEDPFFCLLQDDKYINAVNVTTDRLLEPHTQPSEQHHVHLVIRVSTVVINPHYSPFFLW